MQGDPQHAAIPRSGVSRAIVAAAWGGHPCQDVDYEEAMVPWAASVLRDLSQCRRKVLFLQSRTLEQENA